MKHNKCAVFLTLVFIGLLSRFLPHPPNFTAMTCVGVFASLYLGNCWISLSALFITMALSDMLLGLHSTMPYVYFSFGLMIVLTHAWKKNGQYLNIHGCCLAATLLFFAITNFGVWTTGTMYPKTISGLCFCYVAAIPFLSWQLMGTLVYSIFLSMLLSRQRYCVLLLSDK